MNDDPTLPDEIKISGATWTIEVPPRLRRDLRRYYESTFVRPMELAGIPPSAITDNYPLENLAESLADRTINHMLETFEDVGEQMVVIDPTADEILVELLPDAMSEVFESDISLEFEVAIDFATGQGIPPIKGDAIKDSPRPKLVVDNDPPKDSPRPKLVVDNDPPKDKP